MTLTAAVVLSALLPGAVPMARAEPTTTIVDNGPPANRVDLAIVGDGYTVAQLGQFHSDVDQMVGLMFQQEPLREYRNYFNVHRVDVTSSESGADHPERSPAVFVDTAFDATYNCAAIQRLICVDSAAVENVLASNLTPAQHDLMLVLVNDPQYGGSGGAVAVASTHSAVVELSLHELGHSFGLLDDEYGVGADNLYCSPAEPIAANATRETRRASIKWSSWVDASTPLPTTSSTPGVPGLFEGAAYCDTGVYRPTFDSKMRSLGRPFEQINSEQLVKRIYNVVSPLDSSLPAGSTVPFAPGGSQQFTVSPLVPATHSLEVSWSLDGVQMSTGPQFDLAFSSLSPGPHTVTAIVVDSNPMVRNDPENLLTVTRQWSIQVPAPAVISYLAIGDITVAEGNAAATPATFTVTRTGDTTGAASVKYNTSAGTTNPATAGTDYTAITTLGTLSFTAGQTSKTVPVNVTGDRSFEPSETFNLVLSAPMGATLTDTTGTATILNDDAKAYVVVNDVTVNEGDAGTTPATFTLTRTGNTNVASTVSYQTSAGTASAGSDYATVGLTAVTFAVGETTKTVTVNVVGESTEEANETFTLALSAAVGATIADTAGTATIVDDDGAVTPGPATFLAIGDVSVTEGNAGTTAATFTVTRTGDTTGSSTVKYKTGDTITNPATAGTDYTAIGSLATLIFSAGQTSKTVTVNVAGDTRSEPNETFNVVLSAPTGAALTDTKGTAMILNDDAKAYLVVNDVSVNEGNSGTAPATFTVTRAGNTTSASTVKYKTAVGTTNPATAGDDYTAITTLGTLSFADGEASKTVTVDVAGDTGAEQNETFNLVLSAQTGSSVADTTGVATIRNDD